MYCSKGCRYYGGPVMHNTTKYPQHNGISKTQQKHAATCPALHSEGRIPMPLSLQRGYPPEWELCRVEWCRPGDQTTVSWSALLHHHPVPTWRHHHLRKNQCKGSWGPEVSISRTLWNPSFRRALWSGQFCPSEGDIFHLECTDNVISATQRKQAATYCILYLTVAL